MALASSNNEGPVGASANQAQIIQLNSVNSSQNGIEISAEDLTSIYKLLKEEIPKINRQQKLIDWMFAITLGILFTVVVSVGLFVVANFTDMTNKNEEHSQQLQNTINKLENEIVRLDASQKNSTQINSSN